MTVWSTPMPMYMANDVPRGPERGLTGSGRTPMSPDDRNNSQEGGSAASQHARRHSVGTVPSAAQVQESQEKWLEYAPTSPNRRNSFVSEPSAIQGNPFDIYKETNAVGDNLAPNSFYEAGASYAVKADNASKIGGLGQTMHSRTSLTNSHSLGDPFSSNGSASAGATITRAASTGNPFYDAPLSPIRYNKPIPKVELSPGSKAAANMAFGFLDPLKKTESPRSKVSLEQLKKQSSLPADVAASHSSSSAFPPQQPQHQMSFGAWPTTSSYMATTYSTPHAPYAGQQSAASFGGSQASFQQQGSSAGWAQPAFQQQQQQQQSQAQFPFGFPLSSSQFPSGKQQQPQGGDAHGFDPFGLSTNPPNVTTASSSNAFDVQGGWGAVNGGNGGNLPGKPSSPLGLSFHNEPLTGAFTTGSAGGSPGGGAFASEGDGSIFDPVRQKSLADQSFDLGVGSYFPEEDHTRSQSLGQSGYAFDDDEEEGPVDAPYDPEDDDGSVGDGAGFELQEDQFTDEGHGIDQGLCYTVSFNAPTQFGMLLERKDEWTRGVVKRRERTVVTLVVEGGEAEAKGVHLGSMIVSINGENVVDKTYKHTLDLIKAPDRPMCVVFERESLKEEVLQGYYFISKGPFFSTPTNMDKWKRKYIVLGGPIAKKNVLQVYDSKRAYHNTVVALFQRKRPTHRVKTYALTYSFKCSDLQERKMEGHTAPLKYFTFMTPTARFKSIRLGCETKKSVQVLHERCRRFTGKR